MIFTSLKFLLFFPIVLTVYYLISCKTKNNMLNQIALLASSLFFYACWNPAYLFLILFSVVVTWYCGILLGKVVSQDNSIKKKRLILTASLIVNLLILFFFKYFNFFADSIEFIFSNLNISFTKTRLNVILPVGISFYTFQALGYTIDVYRGTIKAERNFITYALFVTFFPQLVAGPIERSGNLLAQFKENHIPDPENFSEGLKICLWGTFKKVVIADLLSVYIDYFYNDPQNSSGISLLIATIFFAFQILCDFSGYSDIAIGVSKIMGFNLMKNFNRPYFAKSIPDFWRRWHISLSTWFKDYLYIPLGGNRCGKAKHFFNLFLTFFVSGFWHGASWHYVIWGALHGIYQIIGIFTQKIRNKILIAFHLALPSNETKIGVKYSRPCQIYKMIVTFILVCFAWIFFRANTVQDAFAIISKIGNVPAESVQIISGIFENLNHINFSFMSELNGPYSNFQFLMMFALIFSLLIVDLFTRNTPGVKAVSKIPIVLRWSLYYLVVLIILFVASHKYASGATSQFIYFQF